MAAPWPEAVFYDSKNTLFDWSEVWTEASEAIVGKYDADVDPPTFKRTWHRFLIGASHRAAFGEYHELTDCLREAVYDAERYHGIDGSPDDVSFMSDAWDRVEPFPETADALSGQQDAGVTVIVFSNVEREYLDWMVGKLDGFEPDFVGSMQDAQAIKPSPKAYRWVLEELDLDVDDVLYCAGPLWDVYGSMAYGMRAAWVNRPGRNRPESEPESDPPDYRVEDLMELTDLIRAGELP